MGKGGQGTHALTDGRSREEVHEQHDRKSHIVVQFFFSGKRKRKKRKSRTRFAVLRYSYFV